MHARARWAFSVGACVSIAAWGDSPDVKTPAAFCLAVKARISAMMAKCEDAPDLESPRRIMAIAARNDGCETYLKSVKIDPSKVSACLDSMRMWFDADMPRLDDKPECRAAMKGLLKTDQMCTYSLQCPAGAVCSTKSNASMTHFCSPVIKTGTPCVFGACGLSFFCESGKCVERPKKGEACNPASPQCDLGLTCLRASSNAKEGLCGPHRQAGESCHRWTECEGYCRTPASDIQDGTCISFCGSR